MEEQISQLPIKQTPKWLKHLQDNSWEAEILISGGAIFSLFQLVNYLISSSEHISEVMPFMGHQEMLLIVVLVLRGVTIGFLCHLFLRGYWIGLVCLGSAYPDGINFNKLRITGRYLEQSKTTNLTNQIISLDKLSGLIFFSSTLFIVILFGFLITFLVSLYLFYFIQPNWREHPIVIYLFIILYAIYVVDLITSGLLRRNRIIGNLFLPVYWYFNTISLGMVYRPYLQILSTNINKWKASLFIFLLFLSSSLFAYVSLQDHNHWENPFDKRTFAGAGNEIFKTDKFYRDRITDESWVRFACIQSEAIGDEFLLIFIPYKAAYVDAISESGKESLAEIVSLSLNDSIVNQVQWLDDYRNGQVGITANLPITQLQKGKNVLAIQITGARFYFGRDRFKIPFWKK